MRLTYSLLAVALAVAAVSGCVSQTDFDDHRQAVQDHLGEPSQTLNWSGAATNLRLWQLRVTDVVCRLEMIDDADDKHVDNVPNRLCPTGPGDPNGEPPPPPDLGP